jgi:chorismate mutase
MITDMKVYAVRGAVTVEDGDMSLHVGELMSELADENGFRPENIISIQFTQTSDLNFMNAASALRKFTDIYNNVPLFCSQEPEIKGSLPATVRILVTWQEKRSRIKTVPVYLGKTALLRPDISS